ncbi:MAG: triose-phosphate isomerase [Minisyncoccia bacterium]|jgi:triosephosphate isomerase
MKTLVANWKMNPQKLAEAEELFEYTIAESAKYPNVKTIICPPFVFIEELSKFLQTTNYKLQTSIGSQNIFWESKGAYTGEISTEMLKNFGVSHVLVGHSDRRYVIGETDEEINKKIKAALLTDITPVLLVGEREGENREEILRKQLSADLAGVSAPHLGKILFAYEPVWAISTNPNAKPDTPENTLKAITFINNLLAISYKLPAISCLYGGSVNEKNIVDFLKHPEISGAVVGGASLRKEEFGKMLNLVSTI